MTHGLGLRWNIIFNGCFDPAYGRASFLLSIFLIPGPSSRGDLDLRTRYITSRCFSIYSILSTNIVCVDVHKMENIVCLLHQGLKERSFLRIFHGCVLICSVTFVPAMLKLQCEYALANIKAFEYIILR